MSNKEKERERENAAETDRRELPCCFCFLDAVADCRCNTIGAVGYSRETNRNKKKTRQGTEKETTKNNRKRPSTKYYWGLH